MMYRVGLILLLPIFACVTPLSAGDCCNNTFQTNLSFGETVPANPLFSCGLALQFIQVTTPLTGKITCPDIHAICQEGGYNCITKTVPQNLNGASQSYCSLYYLMPAWTDGPELCQDNTTCVVWYIRDWVPGTPLLPVPVLGGTHTVGKFSCNSCQGS